MREVVKKEVLKLLDAGIIYPVLHSEWVIPVQVVPKKGGMTVVENSKNELISQRTVDERERPPSRDGHTTSCSPKEHTLQNRWANRLRI